MRPKKPIAPRRPLAARRPLIGWSPLSFDEWLGRPPPAMRAPADAPPERGVGTAGGSPERAPEEQAAGGRGAELWPGRAMNASAPNPYDEVLYPGQPFGPTHPERLGTLAMLYGMAPAPVSRCRVLELGCGVGGNLIPMAYQWPGSQFLGIDLSQRSIERGIAVAVDLGLGNLELHHRDIMDIDADDGQFDYIIAHGVYSWVPEPVRRKVLAIFAANLAPQGVAYLSYNSYPGSYVRDMTRGMMMFHTRNVRDSAERIGQGRALLKFLAEASSAENLYGILLRDQHERVSNMTDEHLYHDDLNDVCTPFFLHEVVEQAAHHGLQYLCDAFVPRSQLANYSETAVRQLASIPEADLVTREQYLDFVSGRCFRNTLLCRAGVPLRRTIEATQVKAFHIAAGFEPSTDGADPLDAGVAEFRTLAGSVLATDHLLTQAALCELSERWPEAVAFPQLVRAALARLGSRAKPIEAKLEEEVDALAFVLFRAFSAGQIELHAEPPALARTISERPTASLLARKQAETGSLLTSLCHGPVSLDDEITRQFLRLLDGTRNIDEITADLAALAKVTSPSGGGRAGGSEAPEVTREHVEHNLNIVARLGLLIA